MCMFYSSPSVVLTFIRRSTKGRPILFPLVASGPISKKNPSQKDLRFSSDLPPMMLPLRPKNTLPIPLKLPTWSSM